MKLKATEQPQTSPAVTPVRAARQRARLTQLQLCAKAGISLATLGVAEKFGALSPATAAKLAPVLGVEPEELLP